MAIETYLSSHSSEPFFYVVSSSWFRYLWYLVSALFVILAFLALSKGKVLSEEEEKQLDQMSAEKAEQIHASARNFIQQISNADTKGADNIREIKRQYDEKKIIFRKDSKE